ncbi:unnamed protein product [Phaeothamnion confervicola]
MARRRRMETGVQLRKQKREEGVAKRRNVSTTHSVEPCAAPADGSPTPAPRRTYKRSEIPALTALLWSADPADRHDGARGLRKLLSVEADPPARVVVDAGALPGLVALLSLEGHKDAQFEAAWALTNVASSDLTASVADSGAIPPLCALLMHAEPDLREQSAWCLGNVAGDCTTLRDAVIAGGAADGLLANIAQPHSMSLLSNTVWALSNLCRGKPQPPAELNLVGRVAPALAAALRHDDEKVREAVQVDSAWALSYLSDGDDSRIEAVVAAGVVVPLVGLLWSDNNTVVTPALRALGNIVTGSDGPTQAVIEGGALPALAALTRHARKNIRKEACWTISNIAAGTPRQASFTEKKAGIDALCACEGLMAGVVDQLAAGEYEVQKEAAWVLSNACTGGAARHVAALVAAGAIPALCRMLTLPDARLVMACLEGLEALLKHDTAADGAYVRAIDEADGLDALSDLQNHQNEKIYERAARILETYFGADSDEDDDWTANGGGSGAENLAPQAGGVGATTFSFGGGLAAGGGGVLGESNRGGFNFSNVF